MDSEEKQSVNKQSFAVAYDGENGDVHAMNVELLAPALLAFGKLIREANASINKKKSKVNVMVQSDFERKCFNISFEVVQDIFQHLSTFLKSEEVRTAKEILQDLGVLFGPPGVLGLLAYLKWKNGRHVVSVQNVADSGIVIIQMADGATANVNRNAYDLSKNNKVRNSVEGMLTPIGTSGIQNISFMPSRDSDKKETFSSNDAISIIRSFEIFEEAPALLHDDVDDPPVVAWLRPVSPDFDENKIIWAFFYLGKRINVDISDTDILRDAITRGYVAVLDLYKVKMTIRTHTTKTGVLKYEYKIIEVLEFVAAEQQGALPFNRPGERDGE